MHAGAILDAPVAVPAPMASPFAPAIAALTGVVPVPTMADGAPGWTTRDDLLAADGALLDDLLGRLAAAYGTTRRSVAARFFLDGYAWSLVGIGVGTLVACDRVPDLAAGNVAARFDPDGSTEQLALRDARFACLPSDAGAFLPGAAVVADRDGLRRCFRDGLVAHLAPLVAALRDRSSLPERSLWLGVADHCVRVYLRSAMAVDPDACLADCETEAAALVQAPDSPLRGPTGVLWIEHGGRRQPWIKRAACCLGYHVPDHGRCDHCPAYRLPERVARIRAGLDA
jgi:hypothetical protein